MNNNSLAFNIICFILVAILLVERRWGDTQTLDGHNPAVRQSSKHEGVAHCVKPQDDDTMGKVTQTRRVESVLGDQREGDERAR